MTFGNLMLLAVHCHWSYYIYNTDNGMNVTFRKEGARYSIRAEFPRNMAVVYDATEVSFIGKYDNEKEEMTECSHKDLFSIMYGVMN